MNAGFNLDLANLFSFFVRFSTKSICVTSSELDLLPVSMELVETDNYAVVSYRLAPKPVRYRPERTVSEPWYIVRLWSLSSEYGVEKMNPGPNFL